jgi:hypothetical protein
MSLQSLTEMRLSGKTPNAVWVLVGKAPKFIEDHPSLVVISENEKNLDFRPLVGLHVDLFEQPGYESLSKAVIKALDASKIKTNGIACPYGFSGLNARHESMLRRTWELLCKS